MGSRISFVGLFVPLALSGFLGACGSKSDSAVHGIHYTEKRAPCAHYNPLKNLYFGDLHVHTAYSFDAWMWGTRITPVDAYLFAKGEPIVPAPIALDGPDPRTMQLERPLDFAAVTDHSEFLAETAACSEVDSGVYDSQTCAAVRGRDPLGILLGMWIFSSRIFSPSPTRFPDVCGPGALDCPEKAHEVWKRIQAAAEEAYDRSSACTFTSFVAYEYTDSAWISNLHRNVIFRNSTVPELPVSCFEAATPAELLTELKQTCQESRRGCEFLSIPHNSNLSNGRMFRLEDPGDRRGETESEEADLRAELEPLAEIFQHKGSSECMRNLSAGEGPKDEFCGFEDLHSESFEDCGDGVGLLGMMGQGCVSRWDYVRNVLLKGLEEEERLGFNPYKLGVVASTDTHNGIPGAVEEDRYNGHAGVNEDTPEERLSQNTFGRMAITSNPGGLTGVWAEENSRDAIFAALFRRETYATSGTRISVRFFGGWNFPDTLCEMENAVEIASQGVPMGGDLPPMPAGATAPIFWIRAVRDQGSGVREGTPLQRLQVIKGWLEAANRTAYRIFEVAGDPNNGATVDLETCRAQGAGFDTLCAVWTDPEFHPEQRAFYYVRVLENPTCRWSTWDCIRLAPPDRPDTCNSPTLPRVIQERAWTSPIWYRPARSS